MVRLGTEQTGRERKTSVVQLFPVQVVVVGCNSDHQLSTKNLGLVPVSQRLNVGGVNVRVKTTLDVDKQVLQKLVFQTVVGQESQSINNLRHTWS
ncbi:hypothetical protein OGAPHI_000236 [Ogataea philodendri]|uniref:Uncharacterized protein n=1 Tax=Ogataea philodendri TaxID=1378263 RepID=A0A9P8PFW4_9ASCO|nr:uncharacterized protein OGAPHI_000236 [Ogataea philodendri]KAH3671533.1 hypothetical protein OGAPHI_000236 [Ogataea philodendri]